MCETTAQEKKIDPIQLEKLHKATEQQLDRLKEDQYRINKTIASNYYEQAEFVPGSTHENRLRKNVRKAIIDNLGRERYKAIDALRIKKAGDEPQENIKLNHAAGSRLALDGQDVIEFNTAGTGYTNYRMPHKWIKGKGSKDDYKKEDKVSWYNKCKLLTWTGLCRTEKKIEEDNAKRRVKNERVEKTYGKVYEEKVKGKKLNHLRKKESVNDTGATKTRFYMRGPNLINTGKYSEDNLEEYILELGQNTLLRKFREWELLSGEELSKQKNVNIIVQGHSRGAIASGLGAMRLKRWIADNYPWFLDKVHFELIQYDPVAGGTANLGTNNSKIDHNPADEKLAKKDSRYMPLGEEANTTVFYSFHTQYPAGFTPQYVKNPKRIILTAADHGVKMSQVDMSQKGKDTRATYLAEKDGKVEAFRSTGLGELDEGVYIADDQNNLIRIRSLREFDAVARTLLEGSHLQGGRHEAVRNAVKAWFAGRGQAQDTKGQKEENIGIQKDKDGLDAAEEAFDKKKTEKEKALENLEAPKEMKGAMREKEKLSKMKRDTPAQIRDYDKKNNKYITARRSGLKNYIDRLCKQKGSYIDRTRKEYLYTLTDLSYQLEKDAAGFHEGREAKIEALVQKIKGNPCNEDYKRFVPYYLQKELEPVFRQYVETKKEETFKQDKALKEEAKQEPQKQDEPGKEALKQEEPKNGEAEREEIKQEKLKQAEIRKEEKKEAEKQKEAAAEEKKQEPVVAEEEKKEGAEGTLWDKEIASLFHELGGKIRDEDYEHGRDEIWSRIGKLGNEDSGSFRHLRRAAQRVKNLAARLGPDASEELRPKSDELMQAMIELSETANVFYDLHRGHQYSDQGKERRKACDLIRELTKEFYDRLDISMGGEGLGNIAEKRTDERLDMDAYTRSEKKMKELVSNYSKWKKHFALQEGLERCKVRDRAKLFEAYAREMEIYKATHRIKDWPKEIEEVIRASTYYKVQDTVLVRYESKRDGFSDPLIRLAHKHVEKMDNKKKPEQELSKEEVDSELSKEQLKAVDEIDQWFLRNYNNAGLAGRLIDVRNHHGEIVSELLKKTKRERLFIYYLIETKQRKRPEIFDVYASQGYIPDLEKFRNQMLATRFKIISYALGGYVYMHKLTESLQINRDYKELIKDCAKADFKQKRLKGEELEALKEKKAEYRLYMLGQTAQSTKAYRDKALEVKNKGKQKTEQDKKDVERLKKQFASDIKELIRADNEMDRAVRIEGIDKRGQKRPESFQNVKDTNLIDLQDNTGAYAGGGSGVAKLVPESWHLIDSDALKVDMYADAFASSTIAGLGSVLGICYGIISLTENKDTITGSEKAYYIADILQSAAKYMETVMTGYETGRQYAAGVTTVSTSVATKALGMTAAGIDTAKNVYTAVAGRLDQKNSEKASELLKDKLHQKYLKQMQIEYETDEEKKQREASETLEEKEKREAEFRKARYEKNMLKVSEDISGRKKKYGALKSAASSITMAGMAVPVVGTMVSVSGTVLGFVMSILSSVDLSGIREKMFDNYFQFDSFLDDVKNEMRDKGRSVYDEKEFKVRMRRVLAATAGFADMPSACDQISRKYADQIIKGLFGKPEERVEGVEREAYIELIKSFGLPYDEKKKIPRASLLARRMNGK